MTTALNSLPIHFQHMIIRWNQQENDHTYSLSDMKGLTLVSSQNSPSWGWGNMQWGDLTPSYLCILVNDCIPQVQAISKT